MLSSRYFHDLLRSYIEVYARSGDRVVEVNPPHEPLFVKEEDVVRLSPDGSSAPAGHPEAEYVILNGTVHYERDLLGLFETIHKQFDPAARLVLIYYSSLWRPLVNLATKMGLRRKAPEENWVSHDDITSILYLTGFDTITISRRVLFPFPIPIVSWFLNRVVSQLPGFRHLALANILVARPLPHNEPASSPTVSVIVPTRNEAGNIPELFRRLPAFTNAPELILVEGHSTDNTWEEIQRAQNEYRGDWTVKTCQQEGKGKADAVRLGFSLATGEILMILDGDLTVPPEELPNFYHAIVSGKGEFINGSRHVYPKEKQAMQYANMVANKFFALAFSYVLGQQVKDTLCGTKVLRREHYNKIAEHRNYFGDFDPFGDFDLLFGAARKNLRIIDLPIHYKERTYGTTNIRRWHDGVILFRMLMFGAAKLRFV